MARQRSVAPFLTVLQSRIRQPQFFWFLGHFMVLYHGLKIHLRLFGVKNTQYHYRCCLAYLTVTYGIVLYQFVKSGQLDFQFATIRRRLLELDTLQYFVLLTSLYILSYGGFIDLNILNSLHIYSFFHCLNYFKENLLPFISLIPVQTRTTLNQSITFFIESSNRLCLRIAHDFEMSCVFMLSVRAIFYALSAPLYPTKCRLIGALIYIWFFKLRYIQNEQLRKDVDDKIAMVEKAPFMIQNPQLQHLWFSVRNTYLYVLKAMPV